jgi:hypothetical protein
LRNTRYWQCRLQYPGAQENCILAPPGEEHVLSRERIGIVEPEVPHEVEPLGEVRFHVEFLRCPEPGIR